MPLVSLVPLLALGQFPPLPDRKVQPPITPTPVPSAPTARWKPTLLWKTSIKRGEATAAVGPEETYVTGGTTLYRLNAEGHTDWSTEIGPTQSEVTLDAKRAYVGTDRGTVYAIDRQSGAILWKSTTISGAVRMAPLVVGNRVVVESNDNNIYGLELATGTLKWLFTRPDGSLGYSAPVAIPGGTGFLVCGEGTLYRLDATTGKQTWRSVIGGKSLATPVIRGTRAYVAGDGSGLVALDLETGERRWRFRVGNEKLGQDWFGPPLLVGNTLFVSTYRRNLYALEATSGSVKWSTKVPGPALARPALDEKRNVLYVSSGTFRDSPTLTALNARNGSKLWEYKLGYVAASPALGNGRLYLGSTNGYFYAFSIK